MQQIYLYYKSNNLFSCRNVRILIETDRVVEGSHPQAHALVPYHSNRYLPVCKIRSFGSSRLISTNSYEAPVVEDPCARIISLFSFI